MRTETIFKTIILKNFPKIKEDLHLHIERTVGYLEKLMLNSQF